MLYKFKSKVSGDVIMTAPVGDSVLRAMGREPAAQGIFDAASLPALVRALESAVASEEAQTQPPPGDAMEASGSGTPKDKVSLKQRAWPLLEMMKRAEAAKQDIVWGV